MSLYCWGTNDNGSIPTKDVLAAGRSGESSTLLSKRGGPVIDHPAKIDVEDAFGEFSFMSIFEKIWQKARSSNICPANFSEWIHSN